MRFCCRAAIGKSYRWFTRVAEARVSNLNGSHAPVTEHGNSRCPYVIRSRWRWTERDGGSRGVATSRKGHFCAHAVTGTMIDDIYEVYAGACKRQYAGAHRSAAQRDGNGEWALSHLNAHDCCAGSHARARHGHAFLYELIAWWQCAKRMGCRTRCVGKRKNVARLRVLSCLECNVSI